MCAVIARSPNEVDVEFLPKGLHDLGCSSMRKRLQDAIDQTDPEAYEAVLLGYALCGNGTAGLTARTLPLVIPRAHDCIALLMGSRERYQKYFEQNRGVYFRSTGWLERGEDLEQETLRVVRNKTGAGYTRDELVLRYGEENGQYLFDELNAYQSAYRQLTYIATGLEPDDRFERQARAGGGGQRLGVRARGGQPGPLRTPAGRRLERGRLSHRAARMARDGNLWHGHHGQGAVVNDRPRAGAGDALRRPSRIVCRSCRSP